MMGNQPIADRIENDIDELMRRWRTAVRGDERIRSDEGLSQKELTDHVPQIVEEICELIRLGKEPSTDDTNEARANVYMRVQQGYSGPDLVWELSLLRRVLLEHVASLGAEPSYTLDLRGYAELARIVDLYLDLELRYAMGVYSDLAAGHVRSDESGPL